jgi:hypothetical protein
MEHSPQSRIKEEGDWSPLSMATSWGRCTLPHPPDIDAKDLPTAGEHTLLIRIRVDLSGKAATGSIACDDYATTKNYLSAMRRLPTRNTKRA